MVGDRPFSGRAPTIGYVPGRDFTGSQPEGRKPSVPKVIAGKGITITQQYRERHNMTFELDCAGESLILRIFFPPEVGPATEWRIEARGKGAGEAVVIDKVAPTRELALQAVAGAWPAAAAAHATAAGYDWDGVTQAMRSVRAI